MSDSTVAQGPGSGSGSGEQSGVFSDLLEVIWAPAKVFDRTRDKGPGVYILVLALAMLVVSVATWGLVRPFIEASVDLQMQIAAQKGAQVPANAVAASQSVAKYGSWVGSALLVPFSALISGFLLFLSGKITSAKVRFGQAALIATLSMVTRLLALIATAVIGIIIDPQTVRSAADGSLGLARFIDPMTASPALLALASSIDVFSIWQLVLFAIGMSVVARVSRTTGALAALVAWAIATVSIMLPSLLVG